MTIGLQFRVPRSRLSAPPNQPVPPALCKCSRQSWRSCLCVDLRLPRTGTWHLASNRTELFFDPIEKEGGRPVHSFSISVRNDLRAFGCGGFDTIQCSLGRAPLVAHIL